MAASVWNRCMTAAVKVKRVSPSFSGKHIYICLRGGNILLKHSFRRPYLLWHRYMTILQIQACPGFILLANLLSISPERLTQCSLRYLSLLKGCWGRANVINACNYTTRLTVFTARRWLLSAAYTDTKLWEARETEPQNLGKNKTVA